MRVTRRGRCVAVDAGGRAKIVFVDVPEKLSPETRSALNELAVRALELLKRDEEREREPDDQSGSRHPGK